MINRRLLDFDFEKICSITLSPLNCYACLTCGKYFQGRNEGSPAYMHSLHHPEHGLFLNLKTLKAYILPDNTELKEGDDNAVELADIRSVLKPIFTQELLNEIDCKSDSLNDLHGRSFLPGFIGLNQIKANDYVNVVLQALAHITPIRNYFLLKFVPKEGGSLGESFKHVLEKIWNPTRFKAQTSPHEFLQSLSTVSAKKFTLVKQADPMDLLVFLLNKLSKESPILCDLIQGRVRVDQYKMIFNQQQKQTASSTEKSDIKNFFYLTLDLPAKPLFSDPKNPTAIPQVNISSLLEKFNGGTFTYKQNDAFAFSVPKYPKILILHINRFVKNNLAAIEHNPTIVQFSPSSLSVPSDPHGMIDAPINYTLLANIYCSVSDDQDSTAKSFGIHLKCPATGTWFDIENLLVREIQPQMLFLSESYIQIWQLQE
jgi:U4/U6.U5 tri-snRNP-associated protein 2